MVRGSKHLLVPHVDLIVPSTVLTSLQATESSQMTCRSSLGSLGNGWNVATGVELEVIEFVDVAEAEFEG